MFPDPKRLKLSLVWGFIGSSSASFSPSEFLIVQNDKIRCDHRRTSRDANGTAMHVGCAKLQIARNNFIRSSKKSKLRFYGRPRKGGSEEGRRKRGKFDSASKLIKKRPINRVLEPSATKRNPVTSFSAMNSS